MTDARAQSAPGVALAAGGAGVVGGGDIWSGVVRTGGAKSPLLRAVLTNMTLVEIAGERAVVECDRRYEVGARRELARIGDLLSGQVGRALAVELRVQGGVQAGGAEGAEGPEVPGGAGAEVIEHAGARKDAGTATVENPVPGRQASFNPNVEIEHPLVKKAIELFGARVVDVQPRRR